MRARARSAPRAPTGDVDGDLGWRELTRAVQDEVHPYDKNLFRKAETLTASREHLDALWRRARAGLRGTNGDTVRTREAAAMLAHARWMYATGLERTETRGMHKRVDRPELDPRQQHRNLVGGLDEVWVAVDPEAPVSAAPRTVLAA
jgi:succinate dehydrogenase/fumarate reductase flavoprotein subunit